MGFIPYHSTPEPGRTVFQHATGTSIGTVRHSEAFLVQVLTEFHNRLGQNPGSSFIEVNFICNIGSSILGLLKCMLKFFPADMV